MKNFTLPAQKGINPLKPLFPSKKILTGKDKKSFTIDGFLTLLSKKYFERNLLKTGKWIACLLVFFLIASGIKAQVLWGLTDHTIYSYEYGEYGTVDRGSPGSNEKLSPDLILGPDKKLYGLAIEGGTHGFGYIFSINFANPFYTHPLNFDGASGTPKARAVLKISAYGKIYAVGSDGLFSFDPSNNAYGLVDGVHNYGTGALIKAADGKIYGVSSAGSLYSFEPGLNTYTLIDAAHNFGESVMQASDGKLYGVTRNGGQGNGTVYSFNLATSSYAEYPLNLPYGAKQPVKNLVQLPDGLLYGRTVAGGSANAGTFFTFNPVNHIFNHYYNFHPGENKDTGGGLTVANGHLFFVYSDESQPPPSYLWWHADSPPKSVLYIYSGFSRSTLVEVTGCNTTASVTVTDPISCSGDKATITINASGGTAPYEYWVMSGDSKISYAYANTIPVPSGTYTPYVRDATTCAISLPPVTVTLKVSTPPVLYGTTGSAIFKFDGRSNEVTALAYPGNSLSPDLVVGPDRKLYGTTTTGGSGAGVIFSIDPETSVFTELLNRIDNTILKLTATNGKIYGIGAGGLGYFDPATKEYNIVDGMHSYGSGKLIQANDGKIYGVTGSNGLFSFEPVSGTYALLDNEHNFGESVMQASNGKLYGVNKYGGEGDGAVYSFNLATSIYAEYPIDDNGLDDGINPVRNLVQLPDGKLYGRMENGGFDNDGVFFSFNPDTFIFELVYSVYFNRRIYAGSTVASDGKLYVVYSDNGEGSSSVFGGFTNYTFPGTPILPDNFWDEGSLSTLVEIPACSMEVNVSKGTILCNGDSTMLTASVCGGVAPYQYSLNGGPYQSSATFKIAAGTYTLSVKDVSGCNKTIAPVTVQQPSAISITTTVQVINSTTGKVTVNATGGTGPYLYSIYSFPYQTSNVFYLNPGTHVVIVKDKNGCIKTKDVIVIKAFFMYFTGAPLACHGDVAAYTIHPLGGVPPYTYKVNNGPFSSTDTYTIGAGKYTVTVKDHTGATVTTTETLTEPRDIVITATKTAVACKGGSATLTLAASGGTAPYTYRLNDGGYSSVRTFSVTAGTYRTYVKDANNCTQLKMVVVADGTSTCSGAARAGSKPSVNATTESFNINVVPNPSTSSFKLYVSTSSAEKMDISVTDVAGRVIYRQKGNAGNQYTFGDNFARGMYFVQVIQGSNNKTIMVIKQ